GAVAIQHRLDEQAVVRRGHADMSLPPRQQVLDPVPLVVAQCIAAHRSAPKADRLGIENTVAPESAVASPRAGSLPGVAIRTHTGQAGATPDLGDRGGKPPN